MSPTTNNTLALSPQITKEVHSVPGSPTPESSPLSNSTVSIADTQAPESIVDKSSKVESGSASSLNDVKDTADSNTTLDDEVATSPEDVPVTPAFFGTVLDRHMASPIPPTPRNESRSPASQNPAPDPKSHELASNGANHVSTNEQRLSLVAFAGWWSRGNTSSTSLDNVAGHEKEHISRQECSVSTLSTAAYTSSSLSGTLSGALPTSELSDNMEWEPTGPEAAFIQNTRASKGHLNSRLSSSSAPSSLPSTAIFPTSMIKHSKLTTSGSKRRGSASLTQGSLTSLLWSKLVSSQENITMNSSDISDNDSTADTLINQDTSMIDYRSTGGLVIAPTNGNTSANSGKKRWSLFSYGAKDEEYEGAPTAKLRKRGDVLIEPESRPESTKEIVTEAPETKSTGQSSFIDGPNPPSESTQPIAAMRTELADPLAEQGATAPALVGTSEASVVVTSGTVSQSKSESTRAPNSSSPAPSTYSWLSIIPGYSNKTDSSSPPTSQPLGNPHLAENQEIRSMDLDENKGLPSGASGAELTEVKSSKEVIVVKGGSKEDRKSGLTSAQIKGRQSQKSIVGEAGKAMDSLSKIVLRKKNVVLPNYYDQYPDVRQSLIALPASIADGSPRGPRHERSSSIMKSAVNAISSLLFSKATPEQPASTTTENSLQNTRSVRRVVIIGVHGWFPVKLIRTVIGEPTGTSQKFCEEMDLALKEYLRIHNVELEPGAVTLIPLEGEGKVMNRVDILHRNLVSNGQWKRALDDADLVLVATHSQGTPTSTLLIARLINEGLLRVQENDPRMHRVGILAMAGISHGPFPYLKGNLIVRWFEADAAQELFEFMDSESDISKRYREALRTVLTSGIRFTVVASLEDQVVPLYSAIMTSIHHPSIVRAVYIDGASYQDDFLTNLISFSLRLRNSGVDDHGVLVHLSEAVAGSIYGEGHSTIYAEREVYMLAIRALLEPPKNLTTEMIRSEPVLHPFRAMQNLNPFYLPWGMRGVMDELQSLGSEALSREMEHLRKLYDEWNPVSKAMKEIKFRLEPVRSKL